METVLVLMVVAPIAAFAVGVLLSAPWRRVGLASALLAPVLAYTIDLTGAKPSPPGFWQWWLIGLMMLVVPLLVSAGASLLTFQLGKSLRAQALAE